MGFTMRCELAGSSNVGRMGVRVSLWVCVGMAVAAVVGTGWTAAPAWGAPGTRAVVGVPAPREVSGRVLVSKVLLAPEVAANPSLLPEGVREERPVISQSLGFWRLHMLAFLDHPLRGDTATLVAYDVTDHGQRTEVKTFEIEVEPGSRALQLNNFVVVDSMGFTAGHTYELVVTAAPRTADGVPVADAGKSDVYAKGVVTLR